MTGARLFGSPTSPFVRKVRVLLFEAGLSEKVRFERVDPRDTTTELRRYNPLGKVPTLVCEESSLFDSGVICEWICERNPEARHLLPEARRWRILTIQALADGLLDAGLLVRQEQLRAPAARSQAWIAQQTARMRAAIARLEDDTAWRNEDFDLGQIAVACALKWVSFRLPEMGWESVHPRLAEWLDNIAARPSLASTAPG